MVSLSRKTMWFEIDGGWRGWITCPNAGADSSPESWSVDGTLLNGLGYALNSWGSNKVYQFAWPDSSSRQDAQLMKSFSDGTYGRGLVHFIVPTIYDTNILPSRWADPSIAVGDEGTGLVYEIDPEGVPTSNWEANMLPLTSAYYNLNAIDAGYRGSDDSLYVAIPDGYTLFLGSFYQATGSGGIFVRTVDYNGVESADIPVTALANSSSSVVADRFSGVRGIRIWVGKSADGSASVTATAMLARLVKSSVIEGTGYGEGGFGEGPYGGVSLPYYITSGPWIGGMGHSGCRFVGKPSFVSNTGVGGGQVGYAATFREVLA